VIHPKYMPFFQRTAMSWTWLQGMFAGSVGHLVCGLQSHNRGVP